MIAGLKTPDFMTVAEFLAWDSPGDAQWQLINGMPVAMAPANGTHSVMQGEIGRLIGNHLAAHRPGCRALINPGVVPLIDGTENVRIPDVGVTRAPVHRGVVEIREPILLVEILSPGNPGATWANVWTYPTIPSVQEILVVRTTSIGVQLLRRAADGSWPEVPLAIESGDVERTSVGFRVRLEDRYAGTWLADQA